MQSMSVFLDVTKIDNFWQKNVDESRTKVVYHVIYNKVLKANET